MIALLEWALLLFIGFFAGMIHTYGVVAYFPKASQQAPSFAADTLFVPCAKNNRP
ncbi:hypothetical protein SFC15_01845 [Shouchella clausii]